MPVQLPLLLRLGDETAFSAYQAEFDRLYRSHEVVDVLGRIVLFQDEDCEHVCKSGNPRVWNQDRAERIPWIATALLTPDSIRPSHQMPSRQVYMVEGTLPSSTGPAWQRFLVFVEPEVERRAKRVRFVTAFPPDTVAYWRAALLQGPRLYPVRRR